MRKHFVRLVKKAAISILLLGAVLFAASCRNRDEANKNPSPDASDNIGQNNNAGQDESQRKEDGHNASDSEKAGAEQMDSYKQQANEKLKSASEEVKRSLVSIGNNARIKNVLERMSKGQEVTIAYIGGSITEGYKVNTTQNYAIKTTKQFRELFKNDSIQQVNAGLSGTSSTIGLLRVNEDVLSQSPDLVFVEFAVNDAKELTDQFAYESLIRQIYDSETHPAIVLLFTILENGYSCQDQMIKIGEAYELPMISVGDAISPLLSDGTISWSDYSLDGSHPNNDGHTRIASYIDYYVQNVLTSETDQEADLSNVKAYGYPYAGMTFYTSENLYPDALGSFQEGSCDIAHFPDGWVWTKGGTDSMRFTMTGRNLFLLYKEVNTNTQASVEVWIDGDMKKVVNGYSEKGWSNPQVALVLNDVSEGEHKVEIKIKEGDENMSFGILGFGTNGTINSAHRLTEEEIPYTQRAVLEKGNTYRLAKLFERAKAGEKLTIGFIGGSITMGSGASDNDHCYAKLVYDWWCKTFPQAQLTFVNAGIGATTSEFACARLNSDLLDYKPDFVVVEFSVNDEGTAIYQDSYESLLRNILLSDSEPAVVVLNMVQYDTGHNVQNMHNKIASAYQLPIISMCDSIYKEILFGHIAATDISQDMLHPNDRGHAYAAEIVTTYLSQIAAEEIPADASYEVPDTSSKLLNLHAVRYDNRNSSPKINGFVKDKEVQNTITDVFKNGWTAKKRGDSITFKVKGTSFAVQYEKTNACGAPKASVVIDGDDAKAVALDANFVNGWGNWLYLQELSTNLEDGEHMITITITEDGERDFYLNSIIAR